MSEREYQQAKSWLSQVDALLNSNGVLVMRQEAFNALQSLIDETRLEITEYEAGAKK